MHSDSETTGLEAELDKITDKYIFNHEEVQEGVPFKDWETNLLCLVWDCDGHYNGYVQVPEGHIFYQKQYSQCVKPGCTERDTYEYELGGRTQYVDSCPHTAERMLDCHGGITFAGELHTVLLAGWWLGFDTIYFGDYPKYSRNFQYVLSEVLKLAKQLV